MNRQHGKNRRPTRPTPPAAFEDQMGHGVALAADLIDAQIDSDVSKLGRLLADAGPVEGRAAAGYLVQALVQVTTIACNGDVERARNVLRGLAMVARSEDAVETAAVAYLTGVNSRD